VKADQGQVVARPEELGRGPQQLGPDQHRVHPGDEEEESDPNQVLDSDDLVIGAEGEVAADSPLLLFGLSRGAAEHPRERVAEEAEPDHEPDHREQVTEQQRDVVLVRIGEVFEAFGMDLVAQPPAEVEADDPQHDPAEEVEADQAPPQRLRDCFAAHPALLSGSGK
jgi:hypothetical protein